MVEQILQLAVAFGLGYTCGTVVLRLAAQRRARLRATRTAPYGHVVRSPRAAQAVRREASHG